MVMVMVLAFVLVRWGLDRVVILIVFRLRVVIGTISDSLDMSESEGSCNKRCILLVVEYKLTHESTITHTCGRF